MDNENIKTSPYKSHYFIIGIMMLIGGLGQLFMLFQNEADPHFLSIIIHLITASGGIAFIIVAFKNKKQI